MYLASTRLSFLPVMILATLAGLAGSGTALAQYKVVGPDGGVTYTDRPPADTRLRVTPLGRTPGAAAAAQTSVNLPAELQQLARRYPVTLYTSGDCPACDTGRQWLSQRGVPYRERLVGTEQDAQALTALVGGRSVPALTIGSQPVRGFSEGEWSAYLDAAGYPRDSKLPKGWQPPAPTALVEVAPRPVAVAASAPPAAPTSRAAARAAARASAAEASPETAAPGGLRF